jgi:Sec-independent protein translocase protein TatA
MDSGSPGDVIFLAFLVLLLFGPRKLPEIVKTVRRFVAELKPAKAAKTLSLLADRIRAASAGDNPGKTLVALAEPRQPRPPASG